MPDISMCANKDCTLRMGCYRYRAVPNPYRQSFGGFSEPCKHFWPLEEASTKLNSIETMKNQESKQDPDKI